MTRWRDPMPGEREAGERSWDVVRAAYAERLPAPHRRDRRLLLAIAAAAVVAAAALSPPGHAVWGSLRDAVGKEDQLVALPAGGRLLVNVDNGVWVVSRDGSKRFLGGYSDAAWSPHGLYVAAARNNQLVALEPDGGVHWTLARRGRVHDPQWSFEGFRIAYFVDGALRVVNGDGTGDRLLTRDARPGVIAWEPGTHSLAYVTRAGNIAIRNVDRTASPAHIRTRVGPRQLQWTPERRLIAVGPRALAVFARRGPQLSRLATTSPIAVAATSADGRRVALVQRRGKASIVLVNGDQVFRGAGAIDGASWSPDGRWLLLDWRSADQWLFLSSTVKKLVTVSNIRATYGDGATLAGWCCP